MEPIALEDEHLAHIDQLDDAQAALALLEHLAPDQRDAIRAHILEDRSYREIASELCSSPGVVRQRVSRGLARLREQLLEENCENERYTRIRHGATCALGFRGPSRVHTSF